MNKASFGRSVRLPLVRWLAAGSIAGVLASTLAPVRAADIQCLGYDGRVSAGGSVVYYDVFCDPGPYCVLATGGGVPKTANGCTGSTINDEGTVGHEFGDAEGKASLTFSPSATGATLSGTVSGQATLDAAVPTVCVGGGGVANGEVRFMITAPVVAHVQISSTASIVNPNDYGFSISGATRNLGGSGVGTWDVLICPAAGSPGAVFTLKANVVAGGEYCFFVFAPPLPQPAPTGTSSSVVTFNASVRFRKVTDCLTVVLRALEVVQSIQNWNNSIPLIEAKETFVRAHLEATQPADVGRSVTGRLRGFRNNVELRESPLSPETPFPLKDPAELVLDAATNRDDPSITAAAKNTLNFKLPLSWRSGLVTLKFETDGALLQAREPAEPGGTPADGTILAKFDAMPKPRLVLLPVRLRAPSSIPEPGPAGSAIIPLLEKARKMYPIAAFDWSSRGPLVVTTNAGRDYSEDILAAVATRRFRMRGLGSGMVMGVVADEALPALRTAGQAEEAFASGWAATEPRETFAHEIGHILGRDHAVSRTFPRISIRTFEALQGACCEFANISAVSFPHFFPVTRGVAVPCRFTLPTTDRPTLGPMNAGPNEKVYGLEQAAGGLFPVRPDNTFELMSYCGFRWVSDFTYLGLQGAIQTRFGGAPSPSPLSGGKAGLQIAAVNDYLIIRGRILGEAGSVAWLPFQRLTTDTPISQPAGDYSMRLLDATGAVLEEVSFAAKLPPDFDPEDLLLGAPLIVAVPFHTAGRRVEILRDEVVIGSRVASANRPVVQLLSPNGGDVTGPEVEIRWTGSDADGDELAYTVEYSADNGVAWETVGVDLPGTELTLNCSELPAGQQARFRVLASDGFHCVQDESDGTFVVPDKGPAVFAREPADQARFYANQSVVFGALAMDMEEGQLTGAQLEWRSDRDGLLGTGEELFLAAEALTEGAHRITLTGRDSAGNSTHATNSISIFRTRPAKLRILGATASGVSTLEVVGQVGSHSTIEISSNLVAWTPWLTVTQFNLTELVDDTSGDPLRFYRVGSKRLPAPPLAAPEVASQPVNQTVLAGRALILTVEALGGEPLSYQWHVNGVAIGGGTNSFLMLTNMQSQNAGTYFVTVSNASGLVLSSNVTVRVLENKYAVLHSFGSVAQSGLNGWGKLTIGSDGALYGCARNGGISNAGCVFRLTTEGSNYTVLHQFRTTNGATPLGGVVEGSDGRLYGTTFVGGTNNSGTAFKLNKDGTGFTVLRHFQSTNDCRNPQSELMEASDGLLYGTAYNGGGFARGGVFRMSKDGNNYLIVSGLNFGGVEAPRQPIGGLIEGFDGALYGTTELGGSSNNGSVFRLNKDGTGTTVLKSLGLVTGGAEQPNCTLLQAADGLLYGTAAFGGTMNYGAIFRIGTNGADFAVVWNFVFGSGREPRAGLIAAADGSLLGTTRIGGGPDKGTIFRLEPQANRVSVLRHLNDFFSDGIRPRGPMVRGSDGFYYGTTFGGGAEDQGTVFRIWLSN